MNLEKGVATTEIIECSWIKNSLTTKEVICMYNDIICKWAMMSLSNMHMKLMKKEKFKVFNTNILRLHINIVKR